MNATIVSLIIATIGLIFLFFVIRNSETKRENINVIKEGDKLHFFLSDDYFFSVKLDKNKIDIATIKGIANEIKSIKTSIREVCFINFKNIELENKLNKILNKK